MTACPAWTMWRRTAPQSSRRSRRIRRPSTRNSGAVLTPDVRRIGIGFALGFRVGRGVGARPSLKLHGCRRRPSAGGSPQPLSNHYRRCRMSIRIDCRVARVGPTTPTRARCRARRSSRHRLTSGLGGGARSQGPKRRGLYGEVPEETVSVPTRCRGHFPIQPVERNRGQPPIMLWGFNRRCPLSHVVATTVR